MPERKGSGKLTIVLQNGLSYEVAYKHREELLEYFRDDKVPRFQFETIDGIWVFVQKDAIAAIEADTGTQGPGRIQGFAMVGDAEKR